jgi:phage shock protein A
MSPASRPTNALRYALAADEASRAAILETFDALDVLDAFLREVADREGIGSDVVRLQRSAYEGARARTGLPAQMVLLGIRDFAARRSGGAPPEGVPLDEKLYALKGPSILTLSTVRGRVIVPYAVAGYRAGWPGPAPARLMRAGSGFEIRVGVRPHALPPEERSMAQDGVLSRVGRLIAGVTHAAVGRLEQADPVAVVEQAMRDIETEAGNARASLASLAAERHRLESRRAEVRREVDTVGAQIETAICAGRDDLARAGVQRQMDLEAQATALDTALADVGERIEEARSAVQACVAAYREADARLSELKRSLARGPAEAPAEAPASSAQDRALRSLEAISRLTGVPNRGGHAAPAEMDELERLHRERTVEDRLAALKQRLDG